LSHSGGALNLSCGFTQPTYPRHAAQAAAPVRGEATHRWADSYTPGWAERKTPPRSGYAHLLK
jgi:hypothetical protein